MAGLTTAAYLARGVRAGDRLVAACQAREPAASGPASEIRMLSSDGGRELGRCVLDMRVNFDGLAAARGCVYAAGEDGRLACLTAAAPLTETAAGGRPIQA